MGKTKTTTSPKAKSAWKKASKHTISTSRSALKPAQEKILQTMGKLRAIGIYEPTRDDVQNFSGNGKTKEGFKKNLGVLSKQGYVEYRSAKTVALSEEGIDHVGDVDPSSLSIEEHHESIKAMLPPSAGKIFDALADGAVHNRLETAKKLGYDLNKLTGYDKNLSKMSTMGFLNKDKQSFQLTDKCFPLGRPNGTILML